MPGDDLYKYLKDPAPDSLPKFEEESWRKMELLLDKHLPENNNGRVFLYILFIGCIILASLTTFLPAKRTTQPTEGNISIANSLTAKPNDVNEKAELQSTPEVGGSTTVPKLFNVELKKRPLAEKNDQSASNGSTVSKPGLAKQKKPVVIQMANDQPVQNEFITTHIPTVVEETALMPTDRAASLTNNNHFPLRNNVPVNNSLLVTTSENKPTVKKPRKNGVSLTFSTGLETPGTTFNTWGRLTPVVGIGVMYNIGEKIIVRTGVNSVNKIYSAHDKDYNPPNNYWTSYTYFKRIDADCKIIEIPLGIAYRVVNNKKTNVYVSAGASSVIMRKESYEYYYKNQAGRDTVTHRAWNNNSFHLFSNVNFSAIAERKISDRFSLMAEPGIKIPSGGIGVGKIRLYNAGLNVTAKIKLR